MNADIDNLTAYLHHLFPAKKTEWLEMMARLLVESRVQVGVHVAHCEKEINFEMEAPIVYK